MAATDNQDRKIDPSAPAGSPNSLGAESKIGGRPATDDVVVEAMDEEGPEIQGSIPRRAINSRRVRAKIYTGAEAIAWIATPHGSNA